MYTVRFKLQGYLKMRVILVALCLTAVAAVPHNAQKIIGGSVTTINQYPSIASLLYSSDLSIYMQRCGGSIINNRAILTAAHCTYNEVPNRWRVRVGSSWANSGGVVYSIGVIVNHPSFNTWTWDSDVAIVRTVVAITVGNNARPASFAGAYYNLADNQVVWAAGWGLTTPGGMNSELLRHVQIWTINQGICSQRYASNGDTITANMLCSGWLDVGGRDQCQGDSGGPLYHNGVVVGVCSFGNGCGNSYFPGVNARVSSFTSWIQANA